jgi:hypothetical protein
VLLPLLLLERLEHTHALPLLLWATCWHPLLPLLLLLVWPWGPKLLLLLLLLLAVLLLLWLLVLLLLNTWQSGWCRHEHIPPLLLLPNRQRPHKQFILLPHSLHQQRPPLQQLVQRR